MHTRPTPRVGGIAVFGALGLFSIFGLGPISGTYSAFVLVTSLLFFVGLAEDFGFHMSPRRRGRLPLPTSVRRGLRGGDCHCAGRRGKHQTGGRGDATQEKDGDSYGDGRGGWDASWGGSKSTVPPLPFPTPSPSRLVRCHRRGSRDFDCGRRVRS